MNTKLATTQIRITQWAAIIKDHHDSGLKIDDYCEQHGLSRNAYYYWLRKVKEAALTQPGFVEIQTGSAEPETPVEPHASQGNGSCFIPQMLVSVNGVSMGICQDTPMDLLARVIGVVRHAE